MACRALKTIRIKWRRDHGAWADGPREMRDGIAKAVRLKGYRQAAERLRRAVLGFDPVSNWIMTRTTEMGFIRAILDMPDANNTPEVHAKRRRLTAESDMFDWVYWQLRRGDLDERRERRRRRKRGG